MNDRPPLPGPFRTCALITGIRLRLWMNQISANLFNKLRRKKKAGQKRTGTPRKDQAFSIAMAFLMLMFMGEAVFLSYQAVDNIGQAAGMESKRRPPRNPDRATKKYAAMKQTLETARTSLAELREEDLSHSEKISVIEKAIHDAEFIVRELEPPAQSVDDEGRPTQITRPASDWRIAMEEPQIDKATRALDLATGAITLEGIQAERARNEALRMSGIVLVLSLLALSMIVLQVGLANQQLGKVDWDVEWLATLPVSMKRLFQAKIAEASVVNTMGWILFAPFLGVWAWTNGYRWTAPVIALVFTVPVLIALAVVRFALETLARRLLSRNKIRNLQAICSLAGVLPFIAAIGCATIQSQDYILFDMMRSVGQRAMMSPLALIVWPIAQGGAWLVAGTAIVYVATAILTVLGLRVCTFAVREGVVRGGGVHLGTRATTSRTSLEGFGIIGKEIRLLLRDRTFLAQTLFVPIMMVVVQLVVNPKFSEAFSSRHTPVLAYGISAYMLMFACSYLIISERKALWILYSVPQDVRKLLMRKTWFWSGIACAYAAAILAVLGVRDAGPAGSYLGAAIWAITGIPIQAFIVGAICILGSNPFTQATGKRIKIRHMYLAMFMMTIWAGGFYAPAGWWGRTSLFVIELLLAFALWQLVALRLPYLLDPTAEAPPTLSLVNGLSAILFYFIAQNLIAAICMAGDLNPPAGLAIGSAGGGILTTAGMLLYFKFRGLPDILESLGISAKKLVRSALVGLLAGMVLGAVGLGYAYVMRNVPSFKEAMSRTLWTDPESVPWVAFLAIGIAPLAEEFLFRGLAYQGLRLTLSKPVAVLASAALFALVHPMFSAPPVFLLGLVTVILFDRTRTLSASVFCHAAYNAIVVLVPFSLGFYQ